MMESGLENDASRRADNLARQQQAAEAAQASSAAAAKAKRDERNMMADALNGGANNTPNVAAMAANDWAANSQRSSTMQNIDGQGFVEPRWQPDEEVTNCNRCRRQFDYFYRKHHCRHCGLIFCDGCSRERCLLPVAFQKQEPQRVCGQCHAMLEPHQKDLADIMSNSLRTNTVNLSDNLTRYCNLPFSLTLGSEIRKATYSLHNLFTSEWIEDKSIPAQLMESARGIAFLTIGKGGVMLAPKFGTGLVIAKSPDGTWSAPVAIGTFGVSWGLLAGADLTDFVVFLNSKEAVAAFSGAGNVQLGAELDVAVGPVGRGAGGRINVGADGYAPAIAYAHSKGLYAGVGLDGSLIITRPDVNLNFYGQTHEPAELLSGEVSPPKAAEPLYEAIYRFINDPYSRNTDSSAATAGGGGSGVEGYDPYAMPDATRHSAAAPVSSSGINQSQNFSSDRSVPAGGVRGGRSGAGRDDSVFDLDDPLDSVHV